LFRFSLPWLSPGRRVFYEERKRMKKILAGSLTALLLVVLLAACSLAPSSPGPGEGVVVPHGAGTGVGGAGFGPLPVILGQAGNYVDQPGGTLGFVVLAKAAVTTTGTTHITGNVGLSPAAASYYTGFALVLPAGSSYATSALVTGQIFASDYHTPTPVDLGQAILDMGTAYVAAAGAINPDHTELFAGDISGSTLGAGLYKWSTGVVINKDVTLSGGANDVWIFQIAKGITQANGIKVILAGGAQAKNIFWQSFGVVSIGVRSHMEGVVLSQTAITANTGSSINGRLLAQTAVTLNSTTVAQP
jgi:hypothetical protein